jgi:hypothetical protein
MTVRAKFYVQRISEVKDGSGKSTSIELFPVTSGSEENKQFFKYTPSGRFELSTINQAAAQEFELGKEYYVDFTPAEG